MQQYTCNDYRQEMVLLGLKRRLEDPDIDDEERRELEGQIRELEEQMGIG